MIYGSQIRSIKVAITPKRLMDCACEATAATLKLDLMSEWIRKEWSPKRPGQDWLALLSPVSCVNQTVLKKFDREFQLTDGFCFGGTAPTDSTAVNYLTSYKYNGDLMVQTGAFIYRFVRGE